VILEVDVGRPAPQAERSVEHGDRLIRLGASRPVIQPFELVGVDLAGGHVEHIAAGHRAQPVDESAQARQLAVQRVHRGRRGAERPEEIEKEILRDDPIPAHQDRRE
jgi:hypothetical protein